MHGSLRSHTMPEAHVCSNLRSATQSFRADSTVAQAQLVSSLLQDVDRVVEVLTAVAVADECDHGESGPGVVVPLRQTHPLVEMGKIYRCLDDVRDAVIAAGTEASDGAMVRKFKAEFVDRISDMMQDIIEASVMLPCRSAEDLKARADLLQDWSI